MSQPPSQPDPTNDPHAPGVEADASIEHLMSVVHRLEDDLEAVRQELAWSQRLATLGTLSAVVAHETANLLTPVSSYAQLALNNLDNLEVVTKALAAAVEGTDRVSKITASVLNLAGSDTGEERGGGSEVQAVLDQALGCLAREPAREGIELTIEIEDARLAIGAVELQQVLLNLLLNARKAMLASRRVRHRLAVRGRCDGGGYVIEVEDSGPGIPEQIASTLFDPFVTSTYAGDKRRTPRGTGLGLSICRDLVKRASGSIEVADTSTRGTTFALRLPLASRECA